MSAPISISGATVGSILELLSFIISYMDNATLASMARVSKMASAPALSTLWSDMDALGPLLRLLHPSLPAPSSWDLDLGTFHSTGNFTNSLVELPKSKWRWDRFCFYASLVRCFSFDAEVENDISREFWAALCSATDASHPLLPGISKLSWSPKEHPDEPLQEGLSQLQLFLHPDLRDLTLHVPLDVMDLVFFSDIVREYAQLIRRRSPNLVKLELQMHQPASIAEREVTDLLRGLPVLESVCLPAYWGTASVLAELASRPTIKRIHAVSATDSGWGKAEDVMNVQPSLSEEPFHALTHLGLCLRFADWLSLLPRLTGPPLVELFVQLPELFQASSELSTFLDGLSTYQTTLPSLALELRDTQLIPSRSPRVGLSDLMPLHRLHKLEHFELYTGLPLLLTNEELATLLSGLPQLKTLRLSPEPLDDQDDPPYLMNRGLGILTLEALNVVRRSCPNMEVLSLYTSFWDIEDYEERNYDLQAPLKLVEYNMGTSTLRDDQAETVASLLFNFLPHSCQLEWGYYFPGDTVTVDWDRLEARFEKACELVGRMLNVLRQVVRRETGKQQREMCQLKLRIQELESRLTAVDGDSMVL